MTANNEYIEIGKPYLDEQDKTVRLSSLIKHHHEEKVMYFEVEKKWQRYLCTENIDAFVMGLLYYAICNGYSIRSEYPINSELYFKITHYIIPVLNQIDSSEYKNIRINVPVENFYFEEAKAVGTAVSGGVDSFYTIIRHTHEEQKEYNITHLLVANLFNKYESEDEVRRKYVDLIQKSKIIADELNLEMIPIYTNHHEFMYNHFVSLYSYRLCSYVMALQKLFKLYYISAGVAIKDTNFFNVDSDDYDIFNLFMASTKGLQFFSAGGECLRTEKLLYISENSTARKHLHVCTYSDEKNCCKCNKCLRTMLSLDIIGKLENFKDCFDIEEFRKNRSKIIKKMYSEDWHLYQDLIDSAKKYKYKLPAKDVIQGKLIYKPATTIKSKLKRSKTLKRMYFKYKIDYMIYGKEKAEYFRYGRNDVE